MIFRELYPGELDFLTFEEYKRDVLDRIPTVQAILVADDELMAYEWYKRTRRSVLRLRDVNYAEEYDKLGKWFADRFFEVLKDRISAANSGMLDTEVYDTIKKDFINFRSSLNEILWHIEHDEQRYVGTADINRTLIFLKKVIRGLDIVPDCVDVAGNVFVPCSAMFFLELYATLKDEKILQRFQNRVSEMSTNISEAKEIIEKPMVLLKPWKHQIEAFDAWNRSEQKGVIEMATATGKTLLGLMAIEALSKTKKNGVVRIFTHSRAILNQWRREVIENLGLIANISEDYTKPIYCNDLKICFDTVQRVSKRPELYPADLLIVDEVHHEAAKEFRKALTIRCPRKMGLSATIEGGEKAYWLKRLLGPVVYHYSLQQALKDGIIPEFEWKLHTVYLSIKEEEEFASITRKIKDTFKSISADTTTVSQIEGENRTIEDLYDFIKLTEKARYRGIELPEKWKYLQNLILQRRWLIHRCGPKLEHAIELAKKLARQNKVIVFAMDIDSCNYIADNLEQSNVDVFLVHSEIEEDADSCIVQFKNAEHGALVGARMLDEGIDIPDAEIGINVSSSKTRLQLVQRMGRILRKKEGKKPIFYHYIAIPDPESKFYLQEEDNLKFLDDLSWVQDTALRIGVHAELEKEEKTFKKLRLDAEEMFRRRYEKRKTQALSGYGTFHLNYVLNLFPIEAKKKMVSILNKLDPNCQISNLEWSNIIRQAYGKKVNEPLNIPGHWWILVLGNRSPPLIKEMFIKSFSP